MAAAATRLPVSCVFLASLLAHVATSSAEGTCVDGTYVHDGRVCCMCAAGQHLKEHCKASQQHGECQQCASNTYSSHPTYLESCEPCTSCSQPNANLEEKHSCTPARDATCQCKKNHYCSGGTEPCRICNPCKECPEGIKVACTPNNNTVCNDKIEGGQNIDLIIGIVIPLFVIGLALVLFCIWKRRRASHENPTADVEGRIPLVGPVVDLQPYMPDIADTIGWRDMHAVAMRSNISNAIIESCRVDHPDSSQEQTLQLLNIWVESQGMNASRILIESLQDNGKRRKAETVMNMLSPA